MSNIILKVEGLDCAHCAQSLGDKICKIKNVKNADVSIITNKLNIQYENIGEIELICQVREKAKTMGVDIVDNVNPPKRAFGGLDKGLKIRLARYLIGGIMYIIALLASPHNFGLIDLSGILALEVFGRNWYIVHWLFIGSYTIFGADILMRAVKGMLRRDVFNENFHMSIATVCAIAIGLYYEAVLVMIFFQVGEFFQDMAVNRSRKSISDLMNIKAEYANVMVNGEIMQVEPQDVKVGDIILVKPGEKVPLDGIVVEGSSQVDASSLIGESVPRSARVDDEVLSGVINLTSLLKIQVTKDYSNSTVAKIMEMVENAAAKKSQTERFITQFARIYTPIVTIAAVLLMIVPRFLFPGVEPSEWVLRGIIFLMVSCPCALHLSVPLSFFSSIGSSSKKGVLMKGSTFVQNLSEIGIVVFDKTGTITKGVFNVVKVVTQGKVTDKQLLSTAASIETFSNHPIAKSIIAECEKKDIDIPKADTEDFKEIHGKGLKGTVDGQVVLAGNAKLMQQFGISFAEYTGSGSVVHVAKNDDYMGHIVISDIIKSDSAIGIKQLKDAGIKKTVMLSGDREETAKAVAAEVGIDEVYAQLLPDEKVEMVEQLYKKYPGEKIAFVGDGINDAPVLSRVDVGIAMGGVGSDAAVEAADVVIMTDEVSKLSSAIRIAKNTMKIVRQNIIFVMIVKFAVLALAVFGMADILWAVFADSGVALLAVLNSMRKK
jgi:Cd2+/Zn2+-exporting ATPase